MSGLSDWEGWRVCSMPRGRNRLSTASQQVLIRKHPRTHCLLKGLPNCSPPPPRRGFQFLFRNNPLARGLRGNRVAIIVSLQCNFSSRSLSKGHRVKKGASKGPLWAAVHCYVLPALRDASPGPHKHVCKCARICGILGPFVKGTLLQTDDNYHCHH